MASQWASRLPVTTVPRGVTPKRVTFIYPFYENHRFLEQQIAGWYEYPAHLRGALRAIVVDDGSPEPAYVPRVTAFPISLFRIEVDIPWNWLAARNIGAHHAETDWILLTDMDHVVPADTAVSLVFGQHDPKVVYAFSRREHTGEPVTPHSASFFMTKAMFWEIGGYDEALSGHYGSDGEYRRRAMQHAQFKVLTDQLVRHEFVADSCTSRYQRKLLADSQAVSQIVSRRGKGWQPQVLSFPYHQVTPVEAVCR